MADGPGGHHRHGVDELAPLLARRRRDHRRRQQLLRRRHRPRRTRSPTSKIDYIDCGTSGGVFGLERGYCLMIGGPDAAVTRLDPIFRALAPGVDAAAERTPGPHRRSRARGDGLPALRAVGRGPLREDGAQRHRVRADGRRTPKASTSSTTPTSARARAPPTPRPRRCAIPTPTSSISTSRRSSEVWRRGSVVASWLLDLTAAALQESPTLDDFSGRVSDSGEGRWTISAAIDEGVPAPVIATALFDRFIVAGPGRLRQQVAVGDAQAVRRPRRETARGVAAPSERYTIEKRCTGPSSFVLSSNSTGIDPAPERGRRGVRRHLADLPLAGDALEDRAGRVACRCRRAGSGASRRTPPCRAVHRFARARSRPTVRSTRKRNGRRSSSVQ